MSASEALRARRCLEVCPTGAISGRVRHGGHQSDTCTGAGLIGACPLGDRPQPSGTRPEMHALLRPDEGGPRAACAKACPTKHQLRPDRRSEADVRAGSDRPRGRGGRRYLYGADETMLGGQSFYLLGDKPEVYGLPPDPRMHRAISSRRPCGPRGGAGATIMGVFTSGSAGADGRLQGRDDLARSSPRRLSGDGSSSPTSSWRLAGAATSGHLDRSFGTERDRPLVRLGYSSRSRSWASAGSS